FLPRSSISKRKRLLNPPPKPRPLRRQPQPLRATLLATLPPADTSRLLKKSASIVLASFPGAVKRETRVSRGAAALPADKARLGAPGWAGEKSGLFEQPAETFSH